MLEWLEVLGVDDGLAVNVPMEEDVLVEDVLVDESLKVNLVESAEVLDNGSVEVLDNSSSSVGAGA